MPSIDQICDRSPSWAASRAGKCHGVSTAGAAGPKPVCGDGNRSHDGYSSGGPEPAGMSAIRPPAPSSAAWAAQWAAAFARARAGSWRRSSWSGRYPADWRPP